MTPQSPEYPVFPEFADLREIPLSQGHVTIVDAGDYEWLCSLGPWHAKTDSRSNTVYAYRSEHIKGSKPYRSKAISMHSTIMGRKLVDHQDTNGLNNRRGNLRIATNQENARNKNVRKDSSSGIKGVEKRVNTWRAKIQNRTIGHFPTAEEAHAAYRREAELLYGEFARY